MMGGAADAGAAARSRAKAPKITDLVIGSPPRVPCLTHACTKTFHKTLDEEAATTNGDTVSYAGLGLSRGKTLGSVGEVREVLTKSAELPRSGKNLAPTLVKLWAKRPPEGGLYWQAR